MAKVDLNKLIQALHGKVGDLVFRQMPDGSIVVSTAPKKKRRSSKAQKAYRRGTFTDRTKWASWAYKEYPIYKELAAGLPMITAYNLAIKDIAHPPVIHQVLRKEDRILVHASDEIMVAGVRVLVHDAQGKLLESGDASQQEKDWWEYTPRAAGKVSVLAWDLPGNKVRMELEE
jgi:hypothetical protein